MIATLETEDSLAKALGRTHLIYAQYIHRLHGRLGHFWQNRFYSCALDEAHTIAATAYVELNPVRAQMAGKPWEYPWSSAAAHCGKGGDPSGILDVRAWFGQTTAAQWKTTLSAIEGSVPAAQLLRIHTRTGRPLGNDAFLGKVETLLGYRVSARGKGRPKGSKDRVKRGSRRGISQ